MINEFALIDEISIGYMQAGSSAISVLTDEKYFGGSINDLTIARKLNYCPILRKEFILNEYQVIETKSIGADAILLIAEILSKQKLINLARLAKADGRQVIAGDIVHAYTVTPDENNGVNIAVEMLKII